MTQDFEAFLGSKLGCASHAQKVSHTFTKKKPLKKVQIATFRYVCLQGLLHFKRSSINMSRLKVDYDAMSRQARPRCRFQLESCQCSIGSPLYPIDITHAEHCTVVMVTCLHYHCSTRLGTLSLLGSKL